MTKAVSTMTMQGHPRTGNNEEGHNKTKYQSLCQKIMAP